MQSQEKCPTIRGMREAGPLRLELEQGGESISGGPLRADGSSSEFTGWLEVTQVRETAHSSGPPTGEVVAG
jgi:hypothetical protein